MKLKLKIKICEFNELVTVANHYCGKLHFIDYTPVRKINLFSFVIFCAKKQVQWAETNQLHFKNKVKTITLDVNYYEALYYVFNFENKNISEYAKAIFYSVTEQATEQINTKLHLLKYE